MKLKVTDKTGLTNEEIPEFSVKVTSQDPIVLITPEVDTVTTVADTTKLDESVKLVRNKIKIDSTGAPFKIERKINEAAYEIIKLDGVESDWCHETNEYVDEFEPPAGASKEYTVSYRVTDIDGNTDDPVEKTQHFGIGTSKFYIDNNSPKIKK